MCLKATETPTLSRFTPHKTASRIVPRAAGGLIDVLREAYVASRGPLRTPNRPGTSREATTPLDDYDEMLGATDSVPPDRPEGST